MDNKLEKYVSIVPNHKQKAIQDMGFYAFVHFGITTFMNAEWGDGKAPVSIFNPKGLDTDQWCEAIASAGMKGVIATAKHHDGFCLWQTKTTEYSIKNSPYKDGKGDILAQLRKSCDKYGLKLGVYLSPWDRNSEYYGTEKYNDFYIQQLTEILTNYGDLFSIWFDGACGSHLDGKPMQKYDFPRIYDTCTKLQPNCAISNCGPDVRWVGNEGGMCRESEWNVVPSFALDVQAIMENSQQEDCDFASKKVDVVADDLGSREFLSRYSSFMWYPAEVDVSIRPGWFYHKSQDKKVKNVNKLLNIYYNSVGGNSLMLLNIPPNKDGLIAEKDVKVLKEMGDTIKKAFSKKVEVTKIDAPKGKKGFEVDNLLKGNATYSPSIAEKYAITLHFDTKIIDKAVIVENTDFSQRIENYSLSTKIDGVEKILFKGTVVGYKKIALFKPTLTDNLTLTIENCRFEPYIGVFETYEATCKHPKGKPFEALVKWAHKVAYRSYCKMEAKKNSKNSK